MGAIEEAPDNPPSYDEAIRQDFNHSSAHGSATNHSSAAFHNPRVSQHNEKPQLQTPRPSNSSNIHLPSSRPSSSRPSSQLNSNDLYTANLDLPWRYPKNYLCKKCKNTGYKLRNGKICKDCWKTFAPDKYYGKPTTATTPSRPTYSGPRPNIIPLAPGTMLMPAPVGPIFPGVTPGLVPGALPAGAPPPRVVRPGDPAIGGALCPKCRGRGLVSFFLDEEVCRMCSGIGRVF